MTKRIIALFFLAGVLLLPDSGVAYGARESTPITIEIHTVNPQKDCIRFYATDKNGSPVAGAAVYLFSNIRSGYDYYGSTDADGIFLLQHLSEGIYRYRLEKDGYYAAVGNTTVGKPYRTYDLNIVFTKIPVYHHDNGDHTGLVPYVNPAGGYPVLREHIDGVWRMGVNGWHFITYKHGELHGDWFKIRWNGRDSFFMFDEHGTLKSGWSEWKGNLYYLHPLHDGSFGVMENGWQMIEDKWYYFEEKGSILHPEGSLLLNTRTPEGYLVDSHGVWVPGA